MPSLFIRYFSASAAIVSLLYVAFFIFSSLNTAALITIPFTITYFIIYLLASSTKKKLVDLSKYLVLGVGYSSIILFAFLLPIKSGVYLFLYFELVISLFLFSPKTVFDYLLLSSVPVLIVSFFQLNSFWGIMSGIVLSASIENLLFLFSFVTSVVSITFIVSYYKRCLSKADKEIQVKKGNEAELKAIYRIQKELLPSLDEQIPSYLDYKFSLIFSASDKEITGDFYDYFKIGKRIRGFVGDIQGKGARAGFVALHYLATLKQFRGRNIKLSSIMHKLNKDVSRLQISQCFCAGFLWELDTDQSRFNYIHSGLEHAYLCRNGSLKNLHIGGFPLGMSSDNWYELGSVPVQKGDFIFIASDGVSDIKNDRGKAYGYKQLESFVIQNANNQKFKQALNKEIQEHKGSSHQNDDITVFTISC